MKNLLLSVSILFGSIMAMGQNPSVAMSIYNRSDCDIFVQVMATNGSCFNMLTTYSVAPYTTIMTLPPVSGTWYQAALVADTPTFDNSCYYQKVKVPWGCATLFYPTTSTLAPSCCGPDLACTMDPGMTGGSPAAPMLIIFY
jgi:hypothetical protein